MTKEPSSLKARSTAGGSPRTERSTYPPYPWARSHTHAKSTPSGARTGWHCNPLGIQSVASISSLPVAISTRSTAPCTTPNAVPSPMSPPAATATASGLDSRRAQGQSPRSRALLQAIWKAPGWS